MSGETSNRIMAVVAVVGLLIAILGSTGGWMGKITKIETRIDHCSVDMARIEETATEAIRIAGTADKGMAVLQASIDQGFKDVLRRLDKIEE